MEEEKFTRKKESTQNGVEPNSITREKTYASKLKNDTSRGEAMRKKIRTGQADIKAELVIEQKDLKKLRNQSKKKGAARSMDEAISSRIHNQVSEQNKDDNAGVDAINTGSQTAENGLYSEKMKNHEKSSSGYSKKMHEKRFAEEAKAAQSAKETSVTSKQIQRNMMKKEMQSHAMNQKIKESANSAGSFMKKFVDRAEDLTAKIAEVALEFVKSHPLECAMAFLVMIILVFIPALIMSCGASVACISNVVVSSSFTAEDDAILAVNDNYKKLEDKLKKRIDNIETEYPGYDEYNYSLAEISHNPFELATFLTVFYEDYTEGDVQGVLQPLIDKQFTLTIESVEETRTRWVPSKTSESGLEEEPYTYRILNVVLINHSIDYIAKNIGLTRDQMDRYELLIETYGNKKYLFEDDPYAIQKPGDYQDYNVPSEYLTDVEFGNMLREAQKYLGYPYVWGGSSPSTSFDCSGYVSYVINHCGNGWDVGRQTANGLLGKCSRVSQSDAKPGDLVFFKGTYDTKGASHVGIYVGNGMMLHCGNPIQYASINSSYWKSHFYKFGRLNH